MHKLHIVDIQEDGQNWLAKSHEWLPNDVAKDLNPGARLLVDSDGFAFIYILENETGFHHIIFHREMWPVLRKIYESKKPIVVELQQNVKKELFQFQEELSFLLENIEGNGNYGEKFEQAVRTAFTFE
ncbi:hypothetical protein [Alkalicoccobacillus porphyridii]|uniref:Uncharacterized protein n=1 Tax=Alkalicoccobacillus porphyridii TaxID=2597270 RepID=A0A553ZXB5_9BACI|nr:hypothetical protein [Alkalicoccobacillus porphyridii]TSB46097.1 hypothetical protein FN960_12070 [Alkalicoccobacillus porphyridii]